ncbi:MAG: hypothetical protein DRO99_01705 [Candidatus Aenigmatarchaeota archaeon]|nr:MAG: hypothetical protein DRO99_01705 [Candidatus Aenigmarchaeota archaeon]
MSRKVAVLIPTLNEEGTLGQLLESLNKNTYKNKEIIVIDGGSTDNTVKRAEDAGATVLQEQGPKKDRCPANAWNQGAYYADADILCFLDADSIGVNPGFIELGAKAFDKNTASVYAGYRTARGTLVEKIVSDDSGMSIHPTFVRKSVFKAVGGYQLIGYGEDTLFAESVSEYARKNGMKEKRVPDAYWTGRAASSLRELYKQKKWYGRTSVLYMKRLKGKGLARGIVSTYAMPAYSLSLLTVPMIAVSHAFIITALPFIVIFLTTLAKNRGWNMAKVITHAISGFAMIHGLLVYALSNSARKGR